MTEKTNNEDKQQNEIIENLKIINNNIELLIKVLKILFINNNIQTSKTKKEMVAYLLKENLSYKDISLILNTSEDTIRAYKSQLE